MFIDFVEFKFANDVCKKTSSSKNTEFNKQTGFVHALMKSDLGAHLVKLFILCLFIYQVAFNSNIVQLPSPPAGEGGGGTLTWLFDLSGEEMYLKRCKEWNKFLPIYPKCSQRINTDQDLFLLSSLKFYLHLTPPVGAHRQSISTLPYVWPKLALTGFQ